jgi:hypothetical protein
MCLAHLIFLEFVTVIICHEVTDYEDIQCAIFSAVFYTRYLLGPKSLLSILFSHIPSISSPFTATHQVTHFKEQVVWFLNGLKFDSSVMFGEAICKTSTSLFYLEMSP